jgi:hypothetical protein
MMRWLPLILVLGVATLGVTARSARSGPYGSDIWKVRLDSGSFDRWLPLDAGRVRAQGRITPVFLLGRVKDGVPAHRFHEMKVVDSRGGTTLWSYDGTGSDYVDASGADAEGASESVAGFCASPRLRDVDGDGSDDVVFVEHDFIHGRQLRAVRIEP